MQESAELLDLSRGFDIEEITEKFQSVLLSTRDEIETCLLRLMGRGLVNSYNGKWYLMRQGETVLWNYHEIMISLGLKEETDSLAMRIHDGISKRKRKYDIMP